MIACGGTLQIDIKQLMKSINVLTILGALYSYESIIQFCVLFKILAFLTFLLVVGSYKQYREKKVDGGGRGGRVEKMEKNTKKKEENVDTNISPFSKLFDSCPHEE